MARYSVLRLLIFFGFICALWILGLRSESQRWWLLGLSALGSMVVSFFVLRGPREQFSAAIARRVDERARRAELAGRDGIDEFDEDAEDAEDAEDERIRHRVAAMVISRPARMVRASSKMGTRQGNLMTLTTHNRSREAVAPKYCNAPGLVFLGRLGRQGPRHSPLL